MVSKLKSEMIPEELQKMEEEKYNNGHLLLLTKSVRMVIHKY